MATIFPNPHARAQPFTSNVKDMNYLQVVIYVLQVTPNPAPLRRTMGPKLTLEYNTIEHLEKLEMVYPRTYLAKNPLLLKVLSLRKLINRHVFVAWPVEDEGALATHLGSALGVIAWALPHDPTRFLTHFRENIHAAARLPITFMPDFGI
ncbi:hypothetical protein BS50DRAFT_626620 [Corynespora cassiicola Philippines]|uniref:Uncharacterized protein n=1 Tax=Corynespora cassiicola Philippines TaxID=1448308 RepID=A0A2T2N242_CORCC|nr:hypothetical protein BS50DRAFT_626620 [Corynespora cassiicola Philippines]